MAFQLGSLSRELFQIPNRVQNGLQFFFAFFAHGWFTQEMGSLDRVFPTNRFAANRSTANKKQLFKGFPAAGDFTKLSYHLTKWIVGTGLRHRYCDVLADDLPPGAGSEVWI